MRGNGKSNLIVLNKSVAKFLILFFIYVMIGCAPTQSYEHIPQYTESKYSEPEAISSIEKQSLKPAKQEYRIQEGDTLLISVWRESDLKEDVIVRPDGKISFPLAGDVQAVGLTFGELKLEITERLKEFIKEPEVSISLKKSGSRKIIVLGQVSAPGVYTVTGRMTILEAIAQAKGFNVHAVTASVIHIRKGQQNAMGTRLDLSNALKQSDVSQNITLQSEDVVYVPKKFIADVNYYVDQFLNPIAKAAWAATGLDIIE